GDLETVRPGKAEVEQHDVGPPGGGAGEGRGEVGRLVDFMTKQVKKNAQRFARVRVVVHDQDAQRARRGSVRRGRVVGVLLLQSWHHEGILLVGVWGCVMGKPALFYTRHSILPAKFSANPS